MVQDEAQKAEREDNLKVLGKYLKEVAVEKLIKDLKSSEGVPTDSESLKKAFHSHGINMRYLGYVHS